MKKRGNNNQAGRVATGTTGVQTHMTKRLHQQKYSCKSFAKYSFHMWGKTSPTCSRSLSVMLRRSENLTRWVWKREIRSPSFRPRRKRSRSPYCTHSPPPVWGCEEGGGGGEEVQLQRERRVCNEVAYCMCEVCRLHILI